MTKTALVILANGAEELEFVASVDVLRRAGVTVTVGGLTDNKPVTCSRNVVIVPDKSLCDIVNDTFDVIILPGGLGGSKLMCESTVVGELLKKQENRGGLLAAICAAPTVLQAHSIGFGKSITSYPSFKDQLNVNYNYIDDEIVVQDDKIITSRGPGTAIPFGLKIAEQLVGIEKVESVASGMLTECKF